MKMESEPVEVLNTLGSNEHPNEIILSNFEGLTTETVTSSQVNDQLVEYIQVPGGLEENGTIFTQEIELSHPFYFNHGEAGNEIIVVVSSDQDTPTEQSFSQMIQNGGVNSTIPLQFADSGLVRGNVVESSALETVTHVTEAPQEYQSMLIPDEGLNEVAVNEVTVKSNSGVWTYAEEKVDEKEDGTEVLFIPSSKITSATLLTALDKSNRKLLQIAAVPQKFDQESQELIHDFGVAESVETIATDQQDKNVSSSCGFSSQKISSSSFSTNNANEISGADFSNEGLDLSMNKMVQGVSVIHVTSSSDFTIENGVLNQVESNIVEVETNDNVDSVENTSFENDIQCTTVLDEQHMTVDIGREDELSQDQVLNLDGKYQLSEEQDFSDQAIPIEGFTCTENVRENIENCNETLIVNEAVNNRSSSVLVYNRKEIPDNQDIKNQILVQDESPIVTATELCLADNSNSTVQFLNKNKDYNYSGSFNENIRPGESAEREVRKSVLSCKPFKSYSDFEKNHSEPCLEVNKDNSVELCCDTEALNADENNDIIEPEDVQPSVSFSPKESPNSLEKSSVTVIKSPQKTLSRRSKRQSKSLKAKKVNTDIQTFKKLSDEETVKLIIDEIKNSHCETGDGTPNSVCEETMVNKSSIVALDISEHSSDGKTDIPNKDILEHHSDIVHNESAKSNTEGSESPKTLPKTLNSSVLSETILQPPKKTYLRKRKQILSSESPVPHDDSTCLDGDIELFSCTDLDENVCNQNISIPKPPEDQDSIAENNNKLSSNDDDSLLFSSDIRSKGSTTYKRHKASETPNVPEFLETIRKRTIDNENAAKQDLVVAVATTSQTVPFTEATASVSGIVASTEAINTSSPSELKRSKRLIIKKKKADEEPLVKRWCQSVPSSSSNVTTKPLDIENDINEIIAPAVKKSKSRLSTRYVVPETAFFPCAKVSFLQKANKINKKKRGSSGSSGKKAMSQSVILSHSNGSLTRGQLHNKMNEYNFSDSEETHSEDNMDSRGYSSEIFSRKKRGRPFGARSKSSTSSLTWDKFLKSSPAKIRTTKFLTRIKRKVARRSTECDKLKSPDSDFKKVHFSPLLYNENVEYMSTSSSPQYSLNEDDGFCLYRIQEPSPPHSSDDIFQCFNCEFETKIVNNYIHHLKDCLKSLKANEEEIADMDRRQQIRGEESSSHQSTSHARIEEFNVENTVTLADEEMEIDDELQKETSDGGFEYSKHDIVWVEVQRVYWPSLVLKVHPEKNKVTLCLIDSVFSEGKKKSLTVDVQFLQSFNDSKMHKKLLHDGKNQANGDQFVMAVQKAEDFIRKRKCLGINIPVKQFFKHLPEDDAPDYPDTDDDDKILKTLNLAADALKLIKTGKVNEQLINICNQKVESARHNKYFSDDPVLRNELSNQTWFGPLILQDEQNELYEYLNVIYEKTCKNSASDSINTYVSQVLCPEALIRAISLVGNISDIEAEMMFHDSDVQIALKNIISDH